MAIKFVIRHSVTPQEELFFSGGSGSSRWYLDSDVRRKLGSEYEIYVDGDRDYYYGTITNSDIPITVNDDFIYIKNLDAAGSSSVILVSLDNGVDLYPIALQAGESFASYLDKTVADVRIKAAGITPVQYEALSGLV